MLLFLDATQPGKLGIQGGNRLRRGFQRRFRQWRKRRWLRLIQVTPKPIARLSAAAARAQLAALLGRFVEQNMRVVGHGLFHCTTIHPVPGAQKQVNFRPRAQVY